MTPPIDNGDKAWALLTGKIGDIDRTTQSIDKKLDRACETIAHHDEKITSHGSQLKWIFGVVGSILVALLIAAANRGG